MTAEQQRNPAGTGAAAGGESPSDALTRAERLRKDGQWREAIDAYCEACTGHEIPPAELCLKLARCCEKIEQCEDALQWVRRVVDATEEFLPWQSAAALLHKLLESNQPAVRRTARVAVLGSYTTTQWAPMVRLAAFREGIQLDTYESHFGQYRQDILDPQSGLHAFDAGFVIITAHAGEVALPSFSDDPERAVEQEVARWTSLWDALAERSRARIIQHNFAVPIETPMGHLSARLAGSRYAMMHRLNQRLAEEAGARVSIVDCERIASHFGKRRWFDDKYWHLSKQAVSLDALPLLARHTVAVLAADLGLSRKCLVLDLDNTMWGGVIGEDGLTGITLGAGPAGEAFVSLQRYILELKAKGVILAVCSKNNDADAKEPFAKHPDMLLSLDDFALFVANWEPKHENIRRIAETLNIGLDALVFMDDNPAEREIVRKFLPEVEVLPLPTDPASYTRALAEYLFFETASFTEEDAHRTKQYKAKAEIAQLEAQATSIEDFYHSLQMKAVVAPFDEMHLPRIVQLIGKTNQFNLTTRRHSMETVRMFMSDPACVHYYLKLADRFTGPAGHGLVSLAIAFRKGDVLDIDTWLMSCRVIGRTVEAEMLSHLCAAAQERGCTKLRGTYLATQKNAMVKDVFGRFGFALVEEIENGTVWEYDLAAKGPITNGFIENITAESAADDAAQEGASSDVA